MKKFKKIIALLLALSLVCAFAACSKTNSDDASDDTKKELKDVSIVQPPENGATEACSAGQAQFAIDAQDTIASAFTSATPMQVTAVAALLQHNTSCVMSKKGAGIDSPKGLEGKTYLTWDSPIELAMLENVVKADGGDWSKVKRTL